jgi:putative heme-binding domain-containing protein
MRSLLFCLMGIPLLFGQAPEEKEDLKNPVAGQADAIAAGKKLYLESCSGCHGPTAEGGRGPNLAQGEQVRSATNRHLLSVIKDGVKGSEMPPFPLPDEKVWQIIAYLRNLTSVAFDSMAPGNIREGRSLFFGKAGCVDCHTIRGRGGFPGPDLSNIARTRSFTQLRESLLDPDAHIADGYGGVSVETKSGQRISGVARDNTNYAIVILDAQGNLHRLLKQDLREVAFRKDSLMPHDYKQRLTSAELEDLLAFLGRQSMRGGDVEMEVPAKLQGAVTDGLIRKSPSENWLTYAGDFAAHRHSPLNQINRDNVSLLAPKWVYHVENATHLEATPLVYDSIMYVTNSNEVHALDARTGRRIWMYRDELAKRSDVNRGVAILGDSVFFVTGDAHLVALNRKTGGILWDRQYADPDRGQFATLAPMALKDRIIVGISGGDSGTRGFIAAFAAATGRELWRFWTVPAKGEPGAETWGEMGPEWGGAATWLNGTYDPELNIVYWTTGNPWPDFYGGARRGDNLYSDSLVALDADTGKLKWYFQFTPHDTHDWDADHGRVSARDSLCETAELGNGHRWQRPPGRGSPYGTGAKRHAGLPVGARRIQLDVAFLQPGNGVAVRTDFGAVRHLHVIREDSRAEQKLRRNGRRIDPQGTRQVLFARARSENGREAVGIPDDRPRRHVGRNRLHGRTPCFLWRRRRPTGGTGCAHREAPLALLPRADADGFAGHLPGGREAVHHHRGRNRCFYIWPVRAGVCRSAGARTGKAITAPGVY